MKHTGPDSTCHGAGGIASLGRPGVSAHSHRTQQARRREAGVTAPVAQAPPRSADETEVMGGQIEVRGRPDGMTRVMAGWHRSSRMLRATWLTAIVAVTWFAVNLMHPVGPAWLLWAWAPVVGIVGTGVFWQTARETALPPPARLFWRRLTPVPALVGIGETAQAAGVLRGDRLAAGEPQPVMLAAGTVVILIILYALHRLPSGRTDRDALRVTLDAGTVVLATAVFLWHFSALNHSGSASSAIGSLVLTVVGSFVVFTLVKVLYSDYAVIDAGGVRLLAAAILAGCVEKMLQPLLAGYDGRLVVHQAGIPIIFVLACTAAARQRTASLGRRPDRGGRRRSFVLLPYAAVAAVDGLLIWVACFDVTDIVMVAAAAVALTAFVVARQILALVANQQLVAQLDHSANHDPLTGLPNRSYYHRRLQLALTAPGDRPVSLALIDLDDFKMVNDTLGHDVGDALLIEFARRLRDCVRPTDTVARLGGDEFVVLLESADPDAVQGIVDRMLGACREPVRAAGHELPVKASIGIAQGRSGDDPSALLRQADMAMYAAKELPGSAARHYDEHAAAGFLTKPARQMRPTRTH
jgi:diguanylate cyclase